MNESGHMLGLACVAVAYENIFCAGIFEPFSVQAQRIRQNIHILAVCSIPFFNFRRACHTAVFCTCFLFIAGSIRGFLNQVVEFAHMDR